MKPVLEEMLKDGARQEDVAAALQKAQKELVLGCAGCWTNVREEVLWVHAYLEPEEKLHEKLKQMENPDISALCFIYKAAGIAVNDDVAVNFYGGTKVTNGQEEHWGDLVPKLMKISKDKWLTLVLAKHEAPIFKLYLNGSDLKAEPALVVDELYKCIFSEGREKCAYVHIGYPGRATLLRDHVGPAGCYLLLSDKSVDVPPCLISHLRAFVQTLVTAQLSVLSRHLFKGEQLRADQLAESHRRERSKVEELKKYHSMYNQLLRPLHSLTDAVRRTQEDAHEIAAIIHDPLDVLLGRQSAIAELFIEGKPVQLPWSEVVRTGHQPTQYTSDDAAGVAAELLHRLIPKLAENLGVNKSSEVFEKMVSRLKAWSVDSTNAYSEFCVAFERFLNTGSWNLESDPNETDSEPWSKVHAALCGKNAASVATDLLASAKERFFTLYKPDKAAEALSWEVMRAYLSAIKATNSKFLQTPFCEDDGDRMILAERANPLNTHGHLVAFIGRVVAQHLAHHGLRHDSLSFSCKEESGVTTFVVASSEFWLTKADEFVQFLNEQIWFRDSGVRAAREFGDLKRPFVDLIERVPFGVHAAACCADSSLRLGIGGLMFEFSDKEFKMVSKSEVAL